MSETTTITFSYTKDGTTVQDTHNIVVDKIPVSLAITGSSSVAEGGNAINLTATVTYTDATTKIVSATGWSSSNVSAATVGAATGIVTSATNIVGNQSTNITCSYTEGGVTVNSNSFALTVTEAIKRPVSVVITGATTLAEGGASVGLVATVTYDDASTNEVTTAGTWSSGNTSAATIGASTGVVTSAADVGADTAVTISYSYTENGVTVNDTHIVTVTDSAPAVRKIKFGYGKFSGTNFLGSGSYPFTGPQDFFDQTFDQEVTDNVDNVLIQVVGTPALNGDALDDLAYIAIPAELGAPTSAEFFQVHDNAAGGMDGAEADQPPPGAVAFVTYFPSSPPKLTINVNDGNGLSDWHIYRTDFPVDPASKGKTTWDIRITNLPNV